MAIDFGGCPVGTPRQIDGTCDPSLTCCRWYRDRRVLGKRQAGHVSLGKKAATVGKLSCRLIDRFEFYSYDDKCAGAPS